MIDTSFLAGQKVVVLGLGKSGTATARALMQGGARVTAWDDNQAARASAHAQGVPLADPLQLDHMDLIVWSPGIPHTHPADKAHPLATSARRAGTSMVCDVEVLARALSHGHFLAVTGTNGKSTTTTLLAHVLKSGGRTVQAGGNLGIAALDLDDLGPQGRTVLELSSYQLELVESLALDAGVLLNITPDHLARHGGMDGYVAAKRRLFDRITPGGTAVIGIDDDICRSIHADLLKKDRRLVAISVEETLSQGISAADGILREDGRDICDLTSMPRLPGRHNWQNACAVYALARADGLTPDQIVAGLATYPGLAHRQEWIATIGGVEYVNDSKATNADAVEKALVCYDSVHWILGGQAKEGGIDSLAPHFSRIRHAYLIGEAAQAFAQTLARHDVPLTCCGELVTAVSAAQALAKAGDVVLLSPACASWDQFKSFEHRGDVFRDLVEGLK